MTETSSVVTTHSVPNSYSVAAVPTSVSPIPNGQFSPPIIDEEEYTIKCICGYNDDDGNTVFCEKCDTWQHIECYYHGKKVPEVHFCTDCAPKDTFADINAERARERQRRARELLDGGGDRRVKRPASKSTKKKHRDTLTGHEQTNGWSNHERQDSLSNSKDQPPPSKKPKTSHRASASLASLNGETRKRAHSNVQSYPSPSKSPQEAHRSPPIPRYTPDFLELYTKDEGDTSATGNELTIQGFQTLSALQKEPSLISSPENAQNDKILFLRTDTSWTESDWPSVSVETLGGKDDVDGKGPTWKSIRLQSNIAKGSIVGEVRGQIGTLEEYCQQLNGPNRWKELSHPDPFVFFHPHMDIYIDSRRSGTDFRYIRRSCDPNVTMKSYITTDDEVHHCFIAKQDLTAGTELTATWYLNPQLFVNDASRDDKEQWFQERCNYISRVLANFGDCACGLPRCRLANFDQRTPTKVVEPPKQLAGRKRKIKTKQTISPTSNGHPTTSRAGSEAMKGQDEEDDHKSTSESSRNGNRSRDLTPQGGALLDEPPVLGAGLTQREIRKIQMLERAQKEQTQKIEKKQKKRPSGASHLNTPTSASRQNTDVKRYSGSPPPSRTLKDASDTSTPAKQMARPLRPVYVSVAVQTDPEPCEPPMPLMNKRKFCTPTQKLLKKLLQHRAQTISASAPPISDAIKSKDQSSDIEMQDATTSVSLSSFVKQAASTSSISPIPHAPLPSQAAHTHPIAGGAFKPPPHPRPHLSTLPPVPSFTSTSTSTSVATPSPSIAQSPAILTLTTAGLPTGNIVNPSPAKKKLSLGDYMSRRKESATPSTEKPPILPDAESQPDTKADVDVSTMEQVKAPYNEQAIEDVSVVDAGPKAELVTPSRSRALSNNVQHITTSLEHDTQKRQGT